MTITATLLDTTDFKFEENKYDTIVLDPPYLVEANRDKMYDRTRSNRFRNEITWLGNYTVSRICDRVLQYSYTHPTWLIVFHNRPLFLSRYLIVWVKRKAGIGFNIGRNVEYINIVNYHGMKLSDISNKIEEGLIINQENKRSANKPVKLYQELFRALKSKRILDPFAGWANSAVAAHNLGLDIDCLDIDDRLQPRYSFLNSLNGKKQLTLLESIEGGN